MSAISNPTPLDGIRITDLELSVRATNTLTSWGGACVTAGMVDRMTDLQLLTIPHMGRRTVKEIRDALRGIRNAPKSVDVQIYGWCMDHQHLVLALMRGQAVIVPTDRDGGQS